MVKFNGLSAYSDNKKILKTSRKRSANSGIFAVVKCLKISTQEPAAGATQPPKSGGLCDANPRVALKPANRVNRARDGALGLGALSFRARGIRKSSLDVVDRRPERVAPCDASASVKRRWELGIAPRPVASRLGAIIGRCVHRPSAS